MPVLRCKDCKKEFQVSEADLDVPLNKLIEQGKVDGGHFWYFSFCEDDKYKDYDLRHWTEEDVMDVNCYDD